MGTGVKLVVSVLREMERSAKASAKERARREREHERRMKQLERERIQQEKEDERIRVILTKEQQIAEKEQLKRSLGNEQAAFGKRVESRRKLRLEFLNKVHD